MKCNLDCLNCIYPDCIKDKADPEIRRRYYQKHREQILAWHRAYRQTHKEELHEASKRRWENMTEEQKERERARQREWHRRNKKNGRAQNVCQGNSIE